MGQRLKLQTILEQIMMTTNPGKFPDTVSPSKYHVYFQPDSNVKLAYPAIVYHRDDMLNRRANNETYMLKTRYQITVLDRNPDSTIPTAVARLPHTRFVSFNRADGLHHDVFATYF